MSNAPFAILTMGTFARASINAALTALHAAYPGQSYVPRDVRRGLPDEFLNTAGVFRLTNPNAPGGTDTSQWSEGSIIGAGTKATVVWLQIDVSLEVAQSTLTGKVAQQARKARVVGVDQSVADRNNNIYRFPTDPESREMMMLIALSLLNGEAWDGEFRWSCTRNDNDRRVRLTQPEFAAIQSNMTDLIKAINRRQGQLERQIEMAADLIELRAIDVTSGWPT